MWENKVEKGGVPGPVGSLRFAVIEEGRGDLGSGVTV